MDKDDRDYTNEKITVHWRPALCVHSTICYTKLRSVFDPIKRPWINMQGAETDQIIDIVNQCPTKALTFSYNDKSIDAEKQSSKTQAQDNSQETSILIIENGPAVVTGNFSLIDINNNKLTKSETLTLCRCGNSSNMPFCDGTHEKEGFKEKRNT
ncbi:MAG: (4Fe-4S)-binding protein [Bacteroidales bacterium]|nr:(4Fe-4S)-binding protein [Bacteroidales bacterium]